MPIHLINKRILAKKWDLFFQAILASLFVLAVLIALDGFSKADILGVIGSTSLGASTFLAFSARNVITVSPRKLLGGYAVSILTGAFCWNLAQHVGVLNRHIHFFLHEAFAALAMGIAMMLMILLDTEHPPAAGLALGLVIEPWTLSTLFIIMTAACLLTILKYLLRRRIVNLVNLEGPPKS